MRNGWRSDKKDVKERVKVGSGELEKNEGVRKV